LLKSLVRELKNPLILIARHAELEKTGSGGTHAFGSIQDTAEKALQLIDSYLLMAQAEYGQRNLPLETIGVGSVLYDIISDLRPYTREQKIDLSTDIKDSRVMANREGLKAAVWCMSEFVMAQEGEEPKPKKVRILTGKTQDKVSVSIVSNQVEITGKDIDLARRIQGGAHLAGSKMPDSGIRLAIADILVNCLGSDLQIRKINGMKGLSFDLSMSRQLQLV
jgi:hypothetical protein